MTKSADDRPVPERVSGVWRRGGRVTLGAAWKLTKIARCYTQLTIEGLSREHLLTVPGHADTNILWSLGHITYSHARMLYEPSGLPSPVPPYFEQLFRPGTMPATWPRTPDVDEVLAEFKQQFARVQRDIRAGAFGRYAPVTVAVGVRLRTLDEAIAFNAAHEGFHAGVVSTLRSLLRV